MVCHGNLFLNLKLKIQIGLFIKGGKLQFLYDVKRLI